MAFISELHYSDAYSNATGVSEFVEVTLLPGEDPADFTVSLYQANGNVGLEVNLADAGVQVTNDPGNGNTYYVISADNFNFLLTDPDAGNPNIYEAFALTDVSDAPNVLYFFDIGGGTTNITANGGVADGAVSTNVTPPTRPNQATYSVQFGENDPTAPIFEPLTEGQAAPCFVRGTYVLTVEGERAVETLQEGDLILSRDGRLMPLRKCLRSYFSASQLYNNPKLRPIRLAADSLGAGLPKRDLLVSRQHRLLLSSPIAERICGVREVLIPAIKLIAMSGVEYAETVEEVEYFHLLFDDHEIIFAEGAPTESLFLGPEALKSVSAKARAEIFLMHPRLKQHSQKIEPAAHIPSQREQKQLISRHIRNGKPCLS